jgi:hypothetical protein
MATMGTGATNLRQLLQSFGVDVGGLPADTSQLDPYTINAVAVLKAMQDQQDKERKESPFIQPGKAMKANELIPESYAPSGVQFTGGVPYKPNYGAQDVAGLGMLAANLIDSWQKNKRKSVQVAAKDAADSAP